MAATDGRAAWLVQGNDATLVSEAIGGLLDELVGPADRSLVVEDFGGGDDVDLSAVADACQTPPFLADRRVVVVRDIGARTTDEVAPLLAYLEAPLDTTALVLGGGGGVVAPKLVAAVKARGHVVATTVSGAREASAWIRDRLHNSPLRLDGAAATHLEAHLGEDVSRLGGIIDVLVAVYGDGARIGVDDLEPYLGEAGGVAPWDFTDAIDAGRTEVALTLLHRLLGAGGRHPLVVASILQRHLVNIMRVDGPGIRTEAAAAAALGIAKGRSTYPAKKALTAAGRYGSAGIVEAVGLLADAELDLKGAREWPGDLVLEVLVARLCRLARAGSAASARRPAARAGTRR
jgi:DNA polymerase-3 subunit delta